MKHSEKENSRQVLIKDWKQERISKTRVTIIGAGAIGSQIAAKCARLGTGEIAVIDYDKLEEHNLENQMFTARDLGKKKVLAIKDIIRGIDEDIEVIIYDKKIQQLSDGELLGADYYICCLDNFNGRLFMNNFSIRNNKTLIITGIEDFRGMVSTIIPGKTPCLECWPSLNQKEPEPGNMDSCSRKPVPSTFITASHASDLAVMELIKLIHGWKVEHTSTLI